jgi:hypothetical protein
MADLTEMVRGSIDMHVHFGPDPNLSRRVDALEAALNAQELGLRAIVLKSHDYPTAALAQIVGRVANQILVFGGATLDLEYGGLNPHAIECSARLGAKVLWMPTLSSENSRKRIAALLNIELTGEGITILDTKGDLHPKVKEILEIAKQYNMTIASGHISPKEILKLSDYLQEVGLHKFIITHPVDDNALEETLSLSEQQDLASRGAFIEHCLVMLMPVTGRRDPAETVHAIRTIGAEHCIISSDLGQSYYCPPAEGMRMFMGILLRAGCNEKEIELMAKVNPARLLDLD